jgi:ABC-2 type transport system permease protein
MTSMFSAMFHKELKTYFLSPIALMFIATFLLTALFSFFWVEAFFSRNVADIRPLFEWLPILLTVVVPALGMRLWSEERRTGTMELLCTFPIAFRDMVLGKFLAGLCLVGVALLFTVPIPVTVSLLGDLDWGPVVGGYLGTLLLAGSYLAIALCVSASTSNQIVALVFGSLACGSLYIVGSDPITSLFGHAGGETLRALGAGSRFESVLRGVIDFRDVLYYVSIIFFFLLLNVVLLESKRWGDSVYRSPKHRPRIWTVVLLALNCLAFNIVAQPMRGVRLDLTQHNLYSISPVTSSILQELDEPLLIRGYFSAKTHPLLAPLVPRIRDLIEEYGAVGGDHIRAEFIDPTDDPEIEKEANQDYGIKSVPFQFADRHEASVINSYFNLLIQYGDQHTTLGFQDLIEVEVHGSEVAVKLRNLEYDLTRSIQKVSYGFQSLESVLARLPAKASLNAFITPELLPEDFKELPSKVKKIAEEFVARSSGRLTFNLIDPDAPEAKHTRASLLRDHGFRPIPLSLFSEDGFYFHLMLQVGERQERLVPAESLSDSDLRDEILAGLKRAGPGSLKTIGLVLPPPEDGLSFRGLRQVLEQTYALKDVNLDDGRVPGDVDVLLVLAPKEFKQAKTYAIDQFLMRGGSTIIAAGAYVPNTKGQQGLSVSNREHGLGPWLAHHGVEIGKGVVLDKRNAAFPIPVTRNLGGFMVQDIQMLNYPAFVEIRGEQLHSDNPAVGHISHMVMHWASSVESTPQNAEQKDAPISLPVQTDILVRSSEQAWTLEHYKAQPNFELYPEQGWPTGADTGSRSLALAKVGRFESFFKGKEAPILTGGQVAKTDGPKTSASSRARRGHILDASPDDARLIVLGSASFVSDFVVQISNQVSDDYLTNFQLVQNLVDWCLADIELLQIRTRGNQARTLLPIDLGTRKIFEWGNYVLAVVLVLMLAMISAGRRRSAQAWRLPPPSTQNLASGLSLSQPSTKDERESAA